MNPCAIIENVPIPKCKSSKISIFMYHAYEQNFRMEGHIRIYMGIQNGKRIPPFYQEILHSQPWSGNIQQANNQIREYMFDFQLDQKFHGHLCAIKIEVYASTGRFQAGWNFEGFSVFVNLPKVPDDQKVRLSKRTEVVYGSNRFELNNGEGT
jgi:hypothetical protein